MKACAVFIHSSAVGPSMWARLAPLVPAPLSTLLPANLGYPPEPPRPRGTPFEIEEEVLRLALAVPEEATDVHLVGHSYGGLVALHLARRLSGRVRSLWLYEPILFGALNRRLATLEEGAAREVRYFFDHPSFLTDQDRGGTEEWLEVFVDYWNRPGAWREMPEPARAFARAVGWKVFGEVLACAGSEAFEAYALDLPLTLVHGETSPRAAVAMANGLAKENPQATLDTVAGAGHMAPLTQPAAVGPTLSRHFRRVLGAGRGGT